uniref:Uncharacterized protein n=1 Tax=Branchiostoma floridae TaxID=7739 RepID=C3YNG6_BRAFL|eukprot:XP_002602260.1 hypothetical protein BRAFLDRAFT_76948 [Branchiostoma floridae]
MSKQNTAAALMTSGHDHQYEDIDKQRNQTGQGQSQAITMSKQNTAAALMTSGHDHQYDDFDKQHNHTGQGQCQATTEVTPNTTAGVVTIGHDQYEDMTQHNQRDQRRSQAITESNTASQLL